MNRAVSPAVFVSYATPDRYRAETVERTLREHGARTSLDVLDETRRSERARTGPDDVLPESVLQELDQAAHPVALWTAAAAADPWVALEVRMAQDIGAHVLYLAAGDPVPPPADGAPVVHDIAAILATIMGSGAGTEPYTPNGIRLGPGHWQVDGDSAGQHLDLDLTLNDDGTLTGRYAAYRTTKDVTGDWHYDAMSDSTHIHINASFGSTSDQHMLRISLMSRSDGVITGQDALTIGLGICTYTIRRTPN